MTRMVIIPDTQVKEGVPLDHLVNAGRYCADKKPDYIIMIGDWWDMPSLSSYDKGKKSFEGRRYLKDIEVGNKAMDMFLAPIKAEQERLRRNKQKIWKPRMIFTLGNHENRISRACESSAEYDGLLSLSDLNLDDWEVYPFLRVVELEGIAFSHYFTSGVMGRPVSSARLMTTKKMMSCVMGHVQMKDIYFGHKANGQEVTGLFCGTFYQHDEDYLGYQGNSCWRGMWMLNDVVDGSFDEMPLSLSWLEKTYGGKK